MTQTHERRPVIDGAAPVTPATEVNEYTASLPAPTGPLLAVVVRRQLASGGTRTTIYRTLAPAERALDRAAKAGLSAVVEFVRLMPIDTPTPADLAKLEDEAPAMERRIARGALTLLADADASATAREHALNTLRAHIGGGECA